MQDNAEYRNLLLQTQMQNNAALLALKQQEAQRQARRDVSDDYFKNKQLGIQEKNLELQAEKLKGKGNNSLQNLQAVSNQLQRFEDSFKNMPGKLESNTLGRLRNATGLQTKEEANFNSQRTLLFNKIARDLGGEKGVLSDQDIKRIEKSLPDYTDSMVQKQAKMQAIYDLLNDRLSVEGVQGFSQEADPLGIL
jgi:Zn-dependent oligopeptidase